jgi:hypothetical protein
LGLRAHGGGGMRRARIRVDRVMDEVVVDRIGQEKK